MSCLDSNGLTAITTATTATAAAATTSTLTPPASTEIEIVLDQETKQLFIAQENIPSACEASKHLNRRSGTRDNTSVSKVRVALVLALLVIGLIATIGAVCGGGDISKLSSAAVSLYNIAQALALHNNNGTATASKRAA